MTPARTDPPFYSPSNIPLWVCAVLALAILAVGIAHQGPGAAASPAAQAAQSGR